MIDSGSRSIERTMKRQRQTLPESSKASLGLLKRLMTISKMLRVKNIPFVLREISDSVKTRNPIKVT